MSSAERTEIARTIIEKHLYGCDINPYATALTRFRLILAACDYAQPASLNDFRDMHFNIITIDSLIPYESLVVSDFKIGTTIAKTLGHKEAIYRALPILRNRYDVVVGNPPYISPPDNLKRDFYREQYESASGKYGLSAPFTERFIGLSKSGGIIGLINSNAFAKGGMGKLLSKRYCLNLIC